MASGALVKLARRCSHPLKIASTMSGASSASRRIRLT
jgi:hypothetical protein